MINLSVIIVNYNVRYFLAQCIQSILQSKFTDLSYEIIVVDNNSTDGSFPYLEDLFQEKVLFVKNSSNLGFGKACNIGLKKAKGDTVLFLNPDTIVQQDTFYKSYKKLVSDHSLGAIGVKLLDGSGRFLSESKRSFPTPSNSFLKLAGLSSLISSKIVKPYNLDNLENDKSHEVEVLCGAFMMVRKNALDKVGGFDESFFMYGEDIDLCKRLYEGGYRLLYFPETSIIHFKGESQRVKDINYHKNFYSAMSIYASKYYHPVASALLKVGILLAAIISWISNVFRQNGRVIVDFLVIFATFYFVKYLWAKFYFKDLNYYPDKFLLFIVLYGFIVLISLKVCSYYIKRPTLRNLLFGLGLGVIVLFVFHGIMPADYRYSRMVILLSISILFPMLILSRMVVNYLIWRKWVAFNDPFKKIMVVGTLSGYQEIKAIILSSFPNFSLAGRVFSQDPMNVREKDYLGHIDQLEDLIIINNPDEIIFNMDDVDSDLLFSCMKKYGKYSRIKGFSKSHMAMIGSSSPSRAGELYTTDLSYRIESPASRILKWIFDKSISLFFILLFPLFGIIRTSSLKFSLKVLFSSATWVGYNSQDRKINDLPALKDGILKVGSSFKDQENIHIANLQYARNYSLTLDIEVIFRYLCSPDN